MTASSDTAGARFERPFAQILAFSLLFKLPGLTYFPVLGVAGAVLLPIVVSRLREERGATWLGIGSVLAVLSGLLLRWNLNDTIGSVGGNAQLAEITMWMVSIPILVGLGRYVCSILGAADAIVLLSFGALIGAVVSTGVGWKGSFGIYFTAFALAVASRYGFLWCGRVVLLIATVLNAASDARSTSVMTLLALAGTFVGPRLASWIVRRPLVSLVGALLVVGATFVIVVNLMAAGLFGADIEARTLDQTSNGKDLLTSGRAEWAATLVLFGSRWVGYGLGVIVGGGLQNTALDAVRVAGGDAGSSYYRVEVFGVRTDLHSMLADMWFHFGPGGVIVAAVCLLTFLAGLPRALSAGAHLCGLPLMMILSGCWDLLFSPMGNSDRLVLALLVTVMTRSELGAREWRREDKPVAARFLGPATKPPSL